MEMNTIKSCQLYNWLSQIEYSDKHKGVFICLSCGILSGHIDVLLLLILMSIIIWKYMPPVGLVIDFDEFTYRQERPCEITG